MHLCPHPAKPASSNARKRKSNQKRERRAHMHRSELARGCTNPASTQGSGWRVICQMKYLQCDTCSAAIANDTLFRCNMWLKDV